MEEYYNLGTTMQPQIPPFPGTNLSVGSRGENVRLVQQAINALAPFYPGRLWILNTDGIFGNMTRDAVMAFQSIFGLPITGIVGPITWDRLMLEYHKLGTTQPPAPIPPFPGTNLSVGSRGENVRLVQQAINRLAPFYPGRLWVLNADGVFGNMTRDAVMAFQNIFGLQVTGIVGPITWDRLMRESANVGRNALQPIQSRSVSGFMGADTQSGSVSNFMVGGNKQLEQTIGTLLLLKLICR